MSTLTELQQLLHEKYDIPLADIDPDASMQDKGLDSLAIAEFMFAVEDHFQVALPDDDPDITTLAQLAALVDRVKLAKPAVTMDGVAAPALPPVQTASTPATAPTSEGR